MRTFKIRNSLGILRIHRFKKQALAPHFKISITIYDEEDRSSQNIFMSKRSIRKLRDYLNEILK